MKHWVESHKPAASVATHLLAAWFMWAGVGSALAGFGTWWLWESAPQLAPGIALVAVAAGAVKSRLVLDRAARRVIHRILARGDGRCLGGFLSIPTWGLVVLMMVAGRLIRGNVASGVVGALYIAVGTALILSSRTTLRAWREARLSAG